MCGNRACVNPKHMVIVSGPEHKAMSPAWSGNRQRCLHGHPLDGLRSNGYRYCKMCARLHEKAKRDAHRKAHPLERQTHCQHGHPLWGDNCYLDKHGCRTCKTCRSVYMRRWRASKRG